VTPLKPGWPPASGASKTAANATDLIEKIVPLVGLLALSLTTLGRIRNKLERL